MPVTGVILRRTEKACLFRGKGWPGARWIPLSHISILHEPGSVFFSLTSASHYGYLFLRPATDVDQLTTMYDLRVKRFGSSCYPDEFMGFTGMDHEYSGMDIDDEIDSGGAV